MEMTARAIQRKFMVFQILSYASFATMNYFNIYLKEIGFTGTQLGFWGAVSAVIGMATLPLWGVVSDRTRSTKITFLITMALYALVFVLLPLFDGVKGMPLLYGVIILYGIVKTPTHSLQDAWSISTITPYGIRYPAIRKWGSAGFGAVSIVYGLIGEQVGMPVLFWLTPIYVAALFAAVLRFRAPGEAAEKKKKVSVRPAMLLKDKKFACAFIIVFALAAYSSLTQPFYAFILDHAGLAGEKFGIISGWGAFVQVACMMIVTKWLKNVPRPYILVGAGLISVAEHLIYATASGMPAMMAAGTLWGFEMAIYVSVLPGYIATLVPEEYSATAQTLSGTAATLFAIVGSLAGGVIIDRLGISLYNIGTAALVLLLSGAFLLTERKKA